jgi:hypothetical protein
VRVGLEALMNFTIGTLEEITELLSQIYFSLAEVSLRLSGPGEEEDAK